MIKNIKYLAFIFFSFLLSACSNEDEFSIPECNMEFNFDENGGTKFATIYSDKDFTAKTDAEWIYTEAYQSGKNNNLRITALKNEMAEEREAIIIIETDNNETKQITVKQEKAEPFIIASTKKVILSNDDLSFSFSVNANNDYTIELPEWIKQTNETAPGIGNKEYEFTAEDMEMAERTEYITIKSKMFSNLEVKIPVTQTKVILPLLTETFDWATGPDDIWSTTKEVRVSLVTDPDAKLCTYGSNYFWTRNGYLRVNKGKNADIMNTPALSSIKGTKKIKVSFKACRYCTSTGALDNYHEINITVLNAGTASQTAFSIDNVPDFEKKMPSGWKWQDDSDAQYSFTVEGATSATSIEFLFGPQKGNLTDNGRLGFDDLIIEYDFSK